MKRLLPLLVAVGVLVPAQGALAAGSGLNIHAIFEGARTGNFVVGEPLMVSYSKNGVTAKQICWSPAPIDRPACSKGFGAAARTGTQTFRIMLSNGKTITAKRTIGKAPTKRPPSLGKLGSKSHPTPYTATCTTTIYGNGGNGKLRDPTGTAKPGDHMAAYYSATGNVLQVFVYRNQQAGFAKATCLTPGLS